MSTGGRMGRTKTLALGLALMMLPAAAFAQEAAPAAPAPAEAVAADAGASAPAPAVVELKPTQGIGMPVPEAIELQEQFTDVGNYGRWMHDTVLMPIIPIICLFVLALFLLVVVRYRASANPTPSRTSHNPALEGAWTLIPGLVLIGSPVSSIRLPATPFYPQTGSAT